MRARMHVCARVLVVRELADAALQIWLDLQERLLGRAHLVGLHDKGIVLL